MYLSLPDGSEKDQAKRILQTTNGESCMIGISNHIFILFVEV